MKFFLHFSFIVPEGTWFRTSRCVEQGFSHLWVRETRGIAPAGASRGFPLAPASFGACGWGKRAKDSLWEYWNVVRRYLR